MIHKNFFRITLAVLLTLVFISVVTALAATNIVPETHLLDRNSAIAVSDLAPAECDSIRASLQALVVCGGGNCNGSNSNELMLGTAGNDTIDGKNGDDCIVGGGGDDILMGDHGNDVLVGGPGSDTLDGGKRNKDIDICVDAPGSTIFIECEIVR